jgi:hypothetical protein
LYSKEASIKGQQSNTRIIRTPASRVTTGKTTGTAMIDQAHRTLLEVVQNRQAEMATQNIASRDTTKFVALKVKDYGESMREQQPPRPKRLRAKT